MYFDHIGPWCEECYRTIRDAVESDEVQRLLTECRRLRIKCGPSEMIESDYVPDNEGGYDE